MFLSKFNAIELRETYGTTNFVAVVASFLWEKDDTQSKDEINDDDDDDDATTYFPIKCKKSL